VTKIGRYNLSELSFDRLFSSFMIRTGEIPHWFAWYLSGFAKINKDRIRQYKDIHKGKRCFIVATGPSLKNTDLSMLVNEITFGVNRLYLHFEHMSFRPTYYAVMDKIVFDQYSEDLKKLSMPMFLNWNRRWFFGTESPKSVYLKSKMVVNDFFQYDLTQPMVVGGTVTFAALQIAYYMGFQEVILVGVDHNYIKSGVSKSGLEVVTTDQDQNHFHPQYAVKGSKRGIPDLLRSDIDFGLARKAFEADGRRIYDATIGGKCEIFEKVDYFSLFG